MKRIPCPDNRMFPPYQKHLKRYTCTIYIELEVLCDERADSENSRIKMNGQPTV